MSNKEVPVVPVAMKVGHSMGSATYSRAIAVITGAEVNHSLLIFVMSDGTWVYWESSWTVDEQRGKTGLRGPLPFGKLQAWLAEDARHRLITQDLPYGSEDCVKAWRFLEENAPRITYPLGQLYHNAMTVLFGRGMRMKKLTPDQWTCSETVCRVINHIDAEAGRDYFLIGEILFDQFMPSNKRYGVREAVERLIAAKHYEAGRPY